MVSLAKFQQLEAIVSEKLKSKGLRCKLWNKGEIFRLYLQSDAFYHTKKSKQSAFINLQHYYVSVTTECPSQADAWCESQSRELEKWLEKWGRYTRFIAYKLGITDEQNAEESCKKEEQERINETFPKVKGYYLEWQAVRVAINSYGKLATRNRQHIHTYEGPENLAPRGFVALTDAEFEVAKTKEGRMIEPYSTPKFS